MGVTPTELAATYPHLYHMADSQSWESIREHGLLSTSRLLDLFEYCGEIREAIESKKRPKSVQIAHPRFGHAVVRDQMPIVESKLAGALSGCTVTEWYRLLNSHVFFWLNEGRLRTLLCAREYKGIEHIVLTLRTLPFVERYHMQIALSPMNSGNTQPFAHPRSPDVFYQMKDYPFVERAKYGNYYQVVELAVKGGASVTEFVSSVDLMMCAGDQVLRLKNLYRS